MENFEGLTGLVIFSGEGLGVGLVFGNWRVSMNRQFLGFESTKAVVTKLFPKNKGRFKVCSFAPAAWLRGRNSCSLTHSDLTHKPAAYLTPPAPIYKTFWP